MKILAIDTSGKVASVALVEDGKFIDTIEKNTNLSHSQAVLPVCMELLEKNEITLKDIDCFATVVGPGSFTGLRIGIAAAKGFAMMLDKPLVGVSSLECVAYESDNEDAAKGSVLYKTGGRPNDSEEAVENRRPKINWKEEIPWSKPTSEAQAKALDSMYYSAEESISPSLEVNGHILNYKYLWIDYNQAALKRNKYNPNKGRDENDLSLLGKGKDSADVMVKKDTSYVDENGYIVNKTMFVELKSRRDFISSRIINVYPDTLCWIRDFTYAYNEPYMKMYFYHDGYGDYPVVGVSWEQASAFCHWRTQYYNAAQIRNKQHIVQDYRLPTESEWEYAARGGRQLSMYPWGGTYIRTAKGCFLGNFKPMHGNYTVDGYMIAAKVGSFPPNDYGLYDMSGNVAEWTSSAYHESNYSFVNDLNPSYNYNAKANDPEIMKRKVIRGGSWKDIGYYLQCGTRTYEYQTETRSYIGFRCVRSIIGANYQN